MGHRDRVSAADAGGFDDGLTAVVTSHGNEPGLRAILGNLLYQTRPPDEVIVLASDTPGLADVFEDFHARFRRFQVVPCADEQDWGHAKRAKGLELARCRFVGFFNDDDRYDRRYVEEMLGSTPGADAVFCEWDGGPPDCEFRLGMSTSGNFIVRTGLAREAGYVQRSYEADGQFIEAVRAAGARVVKVPRVLYHHNGGVQRAA